MLKRKDKMFFSELYTELYSSYYNYNRLPIYYYVILLCSLVIRATRMWRVLQFYTVRTQDF